MQIYYALKQSLPGMKAVNIWYCPEEGNGEEKKEATLLKLAGQTPGQTVTGKFGRLTKFIISRD